MWILGHVKELCDKLFMMKNDDGRRAWGPELQAEPRRSTGVGGAWWLRDENQDD